LAHVDGLHEGAILDFAPAPTGELHVLVTDNADGFYVVTFLPDGTTSSVRLQTKMRAFQIAALASGEFLVAGRETERLGGYVKNGEAYVSVFDSHGAEVRQIPLPDDLPYGGYNAKNLAYDKAIALSITDRSDGGTVYLMRYAPTGPVHAVATEGTLRRTLWPLWEGAYLFSIKSRGDRLVTEFLRKKDGTTNETADVDLSVWDINSARKIAEFHHSSPLIGSALACYDHDVFTFVGVAPDQTVQMIRAAPEDQR
jgi:hypothetical protein